jgi:2-C-methyl-D-erythritol 4-phosphate cytidylyltransferase
MGTLGAVVVAAGKGTRMGTKESKQYLPIDGKPILMYTLEAFEKTVEVSAIVLVVGQEDIVHCQSYIEEYGLVKISAIVPGGSSRQESVFIGLQHLHTEWIVVHDGVRPFVTAEDINRCWEAAKQYGAAVTAVPVKDTIKIADEEGMVRSTPNRNSLWAIQTPQAFRRTGLVMAHERAAIEGYQGTDDAALVERAGIPVRIVEGDYGNIKITTPEDLLWAEFRLVHRQGVGKKR